MTQNRLDCLLLTVKDGHAMSAFRHWKTMVKQRLRSDFRSFNSVNLSWVVIFVGENINHGKDCSITSEKYKSWEGLFYHKRKI